MTHPASNVSLERFLKRQSMRWAWIGLLMTVLVAVPCALYTAKLASERQARVIAKAAMRAFRPMILAENIRDAELQMSKALALREGESALVRDPQLNAIYPFREQDKTPVCNLSNLLCWKSGFRAVSILQPIYFDDEHSEGLFGYLEVTLKPTLDWGVLAFLVVLIFAAFFVQAIGFTSVLNRTAGILKDQLNDWASYLKNSPSSRVKASVAPFTELESLENAIGGLHLQIESLQQYAASQARSEAQFAMVREISHDLKTPHSLLARYFALHVDTVKTTGKVNFDEVFKVERTMRRMGDLLRQIPAFSQNTNSLRDRNLCRIDLESQAIVEDARQIDAVIEKKAVIELCVESQNPEVRIERAAFYRVLDNLVRNAVEAVPNGYGHVEVCIATQNGRHTISVRDNGNGIPVEIRDRIFDLDFTTKSSRGTGLGLGITKRLCDGVGAQITFESEVGRGTTFTVSFPLPTVETKETRSYA